MFYTNFLYHLHTFEILSVTVAIIFVSKSTIKIPARKGPNGEPMSAPWIC